MGEEKRGGELETFPGPLGPEQECAVGKDAAAGAKLSADHEVGLGRGWEGRWTRRLGNVAWRVTRPPVRSRAFSAYPACGSAALDGQTLVAAQVTPHARGQLAPFQTPQLWGPRAGGENGACRITLLLALFIGSDRICGTKSGRQPRGRKRQVEKQKTGYSRVLEGHRLSLSRFTRCPTCC